jgi:Concanavalin A-like lectin/glucanases superfamily/Right handed beta helix region
VLINEKRMRMNINKSCICLVLVSAMLCVGASYADWQGQHTPDGNTIGLWHFDEGSSDIAYNSVTGNNVTLHNGANWSTNTPDGSSSCLNLSLAAPNTDYAHLLNYDDLVIQRQSMTWEFWMYPIETDIDLGRGDPVNAYGKVEWAYEHNVGGGTIRFFIYDWEYSPAGGGVSILTSNSIIPTGQWTHVAGVWNEETHTQEIWINGVLDAWQDPSPKGLYTVSYNIDMGCATSYEGTVYNFAGLVDEFRVSNLARYIDEDDTTPDSWSPWYPEKKLRIDRVDTGMKLTWHSFPGASYDVEWTDSIDGNWSSMGLGLTGTGDSMSYIDITSAEKRFYRTIASGNANCVIVTPSDDLEAIIEEVPDSTTIVLTSGTFNFEQRGSYPLWYGTIIQDKTNLTITGQGWDNTRIKLAPDVFIGFYMGSNVQNLTIENLRIEGTLPFTVAPFFGPHAIGNYSGSTNLHNITFRKLWVQDVAVGISANTGITGVYDGVTIVDNVVTNILGTESGSGYGIHCSNARNVLIANNYIEKAGRHSIYQARGDTNANIIIENNFILNHDYYGEQPRWYAPALACARTSNVKIANNIILNPRVIGMTIYSDEDLGWPVVDIIAFNNQIIAGRYTGIGVTSGDTHFFPDNIGDTHTFLGNNIIHYPGNTYPEISSYHYANGWPTDSHWAAPNPRWDDPDYIAELDGLIYIMKDGTLDKITPYTWAYTTCPGIWTNVEGMTALKDAVGVGESRLYIAASGNLYEVDPQAWWSTAVAANWGGTQLMTATSGYVHVMKDNVLYQVMPSTLNSANSSGGWSNPHWMGDWGGNLYLFDDDTCYRIDPGTLQDTICGL